MRIKKSVICSLVLIFSFVLSYEYCYALEGIVTGTDVRIRSGAGTSYVSLLDDAGYNKKYTLLDSKLYSTSDGTSGCDSGKWYKVSYNNQSGYICSSFFQVTSNKEEDNSEVGSVVLPDSKGIVACYEDTSSLTFRSEPGGDGIGVLNCGDQVEIIDTDVSDINGCYSWYKVKKSNTVGYVCGKYITTTSLSKKALEFYKKNSLEEYNKKLLDDGFPKSYLPYLDELHARYPNWKFEALKTNFDYSTVTSLESAVGISLIQDSEGYRSTAGGSYNYYTDSWNVLDGSNWYAANHATVSYYMDPRLYLKPNYIFMFEKLNYDSKYHSIEKIENILSLTKLGNYDKNYASYYLEAGKKYNVSPIHLASRTRQEIGSSTSVISGMEFSYNGKTYKNLFNTYNIGATSGADNWKKGLIFANGGEDGTSKSTHYGRPWNTLEKAITGGAQFISDGYINNNQYTAYLQKFNVNNGKSKIGVHQYMTNIRAPLGEASSTYDSYQSFDMLNSEFVFVIPVYENMEEMYVLPKEGNPNNYLKNISINGSLITGFDGSINTYDVYVSESTKNLGISVKTVNKGSKLSGTVKGVGEASADVEIKDKKSVFKIDVTALNGSVRTYTINIIKQVSNETDDDTNNNPIKPDDNTNNNTGSNIENNNNEKPDNEKKPEINDNNKPENQEKPDDQEKPEPSDNTTSEKKEVDFGLIVNNSGYMLNDSYITGINVNTSVSSFINSIKKQDALVDVSVLKNGVKLNDKDFIGTGTTIKLSKDEQNSSFEIVIFGDASGDGKINALDLLKVQKHILGLTKLNGSYLQGANSSKDTSATINALDLLKIQKHILGINLIKQ